MPVPFSRESHRIKAYTDESCLETVSLEVRSALHDTASGVCIYVHTDGARCANVVPLCVYMCVCVSVCVYVRMCVVCVQVCMCV